MSNLIAEADLKSPSFALTTCSRRWQHLVAGTLLAYATMMTPAHSNGFPPFPEPAVGPFPDTVNMRLLSQLLPAEIGAVTPRSGILLNDIWGWTSPRDEEYALIGTGDGMAVVRVTDPKNPEFIGIMPTPQPASVANLWGDVAVFNVRNDDDDDERHGHDDDDDDDDERHGHDDNDDDDDERHGHDDEGDDERGDSFTGYAYFVTEADGAGISILELNKLDWMGPAPDPSFPIPPDAVFSGGGYDSAHNIYVHQKTGHAYVMGVGLVDIGETACDDHPYHPSRFNTMILDLNDDPLNPRVVNCLADFGEHDIYVVSYRGPDRDYRGREIAFVFDGRDKDTESRGGQRQDDTPGALGGGTTEIWDVTDIENVHVIASFTVPGICFSHQGWTSSRRHEFLLINDEVDELRDAEDADGFFRTSFCSTQAPPGTITNPGIYVVNIRDLDNPFLQERFSVESPGDNDHNFIRKGNKLYWAVYNAGTRVIKLRKKHGQLMLREIARLDSEPRMPPVFNGQWGIFPFPNSRTIVASDIVNGLMVMRLDRRRDRDHDSDDEVPNWGASVRTAPAVAAATLQTQEQRAAARQAWIDYVKSRIIY